MVKHMPGIREALGSSPSIKITIKKLQVKSSLVTQSLGLAASMSNFNSATTLGNKVPRVNFHGSGRTWNQTKRDQELCPAGD